MSKVPSLNYEKVIPIKRSTLSHVIKQAGLSLDDFLDLLR